ncbi:3-methyladenine DNA glycosylase AlkC [Pedobacter cryoconitis]|uniref:3-methyladenine DNA glycosylase AlkC n=1 Tax=Pedobacter cryoconitis TaxID=188932 RepID=A0A7W8YX59_9SPHI|nr:DNA alkylation repair protein [Pedobacter cryoconitis]MBB5623282.1 3-methyladenine DNA glycosylase AlkC [Pedobacter cryoconitis]MBB5646745.1 3-methyladenine DNA glycosylase AlkC [Pedobacter cryoconitis]
MSLLKDIYSVPFYNKLADTLIQLNPEFNKKRFIELINVEGFTAMELKQRMHHTTLVIHQFLPSGYPEAIQHLSSLIHQLKKQQTGEQLLAYIFLPDYIETYGLEDYETSIQAIESVTQFISCEFAVRPFLAKYGQQMMQQMEKWSLHENHHVRRLASEGSRSRLPWAMAVPGLKKDPFMILPILENLKNDPSEYVRRSVANSLNDISKDHPEIVIAIAGRWKGLSKETDAIIKHGCRGLLKQGHTKILAHYGLESTAIELLDFEILTAAVAIGESLEFTISVKNIATVQQKIRLEYAVYYKRLNGQVSKKVFKISEREFQPAEIAVINRKQSFKIITTRKFYPGAHQLAIILNGRESELKDFELK